MSVDQESDGGSNQELSTKRIQLQEDLQTPAKKRAKQASLAAFVLSSKSPKIESVDLSSIGGFQYITSFLPNNICAQYYEELSKLPHWEFQQMLVYGKACNAHRMTCSFSKEIDTRYRYSGTRQRTHLFSSSAAIQAIVDAVETMFVTEQPFAQRINFILLNYYKDGSHTLGFHSDDERDLIGPVYGVSLNEAGDDPTQRRFFDIVEIKTGLKKRLPIDNGSLMVMQSSFQRTYKHGIPAQKTIKTGRINLTLRSVRSTRTTDT